MIEIPIDDVATILAYTDATREKIINAKPIGSFTINLRVVFLEDQYYVYVKTSGSHYTKRLGPIPTEDLAFQVHIEELASWQALCDTVLETVRLGNADQVAGA